MFVVCLEGIYSSCFSKIRSDSTLMSVSAGWHWSTSITMLSWPGKTWQSCSRRLAVSSGLLFALNTGPGPAASCSLCSVSLTIRYPLLLPPPAASVKPSVLSRKFMTSVWERGVLEEEKVVEIPAKEWFPGSGVLREKKNFIQRTRHTIFLWFRKYLTHP